MFQKLGKFLYLCPVISNKAIMNYILPVLTLLGSLGLFLYGMTMMSESLQKVAGNRLRSILAAMTSTPLNRILTGTLITAIIQSSSATTVMVVSFVNAGLLTLTQSVGVIMGANIGTTVTAWLISLLGFKADISALSIPLIGIGFALMMFKSSKRKNLGELLIGFALLFLGLSFLKNSVPDLSTQPEVLEFIKQWTSWGFWSVLIFVGLGTILTIILQSSSATMALTLVMCNFGWIPFEMAAAMVLGENIGTTITANIAASVANANAKRAARAHSIFNIFGVIWVLILFKPFLWLVSIIITAIGAENPLDPATATSSPTSILYAVAMVHSLFNVLNAAILVWFTPQIVKIVTAMVKSDPEETAPKLKFIQGGVLGTAELSLDQAHQEIVHFGKIIKQQFSYAREAVNNADNADKFDELFKKLEKYEKITDEVELEVAKYLHRVNQGFLSKDASQRIQAMYTIINELESLGDSGYNIGRILTRKNVQNKQFNEETLRRLNKMMDLVDDAIDVMITNLSSGYKKLDNITNAQDCESRINEYRNLLKEEHMVQIRQNDAEYHTGIYYMDLVNEMEAMGDYLINISEAIIEADED